MEAEVAEIAIPGGTCRAFPVKVLSYNVRGIEMEVYKKSNSR